MRYTRSFISFFILTMLVGLGSLVLSTDQVRAGFSPCEIGIVKIAIPADNTPFNFSVPELIPDNFVLNDPDNDSTMFSLTDKNRTANVTENVPPGWILDDIVCESRDSVTISEISNGISFSCSGGGGGAPHATCTFFNVKVVTSPIPTLSEWGLVAMAGILGLVGFMVIRRKKVTG